MEPLEPGDMMPIGPCHGCGREIDDRDQRWCPICDLQICDECTEPDGWCRKCAEDQAKAEVTWSEEG